MKKVAVIAAAGLLVVAAWAMLTRGEELPPKPQDARSKPLGGGAAQIWPRSQQVEPGVEYIYETGHCGLAFDLDFDGSFWPAVNPNGDREAPSFFINQDDGYITLVSEDEARYEASTGKEIEPRRIHGPVIVGGNCA